MTRTATYYHDRAGRPHATIEAKVEADLAFVLGSFAYARKIIIKREEVLALLSEMDGDVVRLERKRA